IQPHARALSLPQGKVGRSHSEHSAKGSCQMRRVGEPGAVSGCRHIGAGHQVAASALQTQPENTWPERNPRGLGENVHETGLRQARNACQSLQGKVIRKAKLLSQVLEYKTYAGVDLHGAAPTK